MHERGVSEGPSTRFTRPRSYAAPAGVFVMSRSAQSRPYAPAMSLQPSVLSPQNAISCLALHMPTSRAQEAPSLWRPLRTPIFRQLLVADVVSDIGTFMQGVGAAWLMVSLGASPMYVALTQTASTLPFFLFALPAGSIADIVDRRRLILYTEAWMLCVA